MTYLTENPLPLAVMFFLLAAFFAWNAMRTGNKKLWQVASGCAVLGVLPIVVDQLVVTDREEVEATLRELAEAVVDNDFQKVLSFVDGAEDLAIKDNMDRVHVHEGLRIKQVQVEVDGTQATSDFRANGTVDIKGVDNNRYIASRWQLKWRKAVSDWKITRIAQLNPVNGDVIRSFGGE